MKVPSKLLVAGAAVAAAGIVPSAALADVSTPQVVAGTTQTTLSISVPTAATFTTGFGPNGQEATSTTATVAALSTNPSWSLTAKDWGTGAGDGDGTMNKLTAAGATSLQGISGADLPSLGDPTLCADSEAQLVNPIKVQVDPSVVSASIESLGKVALDGTGVTVADSNPASLLPLPLTTFNTTFFQTIGSDEPVSAGCQYHVEVAYTLS